MEKLGTPQSHRDAFDKLEKNRIIEKELGDRLKSMAGFRNLAVHDYSSLNLDVVINIIDNHLKELQLFAEQMLQR